MQEVSSYIRSEGKHIGSQESLKIFGFTFSNNPNLCMHAKIMV